MSLLAWISVGVYAVGFFPVLFALGFVMYDRDDSTFQVGLAAVLALLMTSVWPIVLGAGGIVLAIVWCVGRLIELGLRKE